MSDVFIKLVNMSITASWMVLAVVVLRLMLKKAPRWLSCLLWGAVGLRLVLPFSFESVLSLIPSTETIRTTALVGRPFEVNVGVPAIDETVNGYLGGHYYEGVTVPTDTFWDTAAIVTLVWVIGVAVMLAYSVVSYIRLHKTVAVSLRERENIFVCDAIDSPFIFGIIRPRIYLPSTLTEEQKRHVIAHEQAHLKRRDHWFKPLGFALLSVYWFNPVLWVAYILFCRDIEAACDEKVIAAMDAQGKKSYSEALVSCSMHRRKIMVCPLAFGEVGVKARIRSILHYKKPTVWILAASLILCTVAGVCLLTDPPEDTAPVATVEDATAYFEEKLQGEADEYFESFHGIGLETGVAVTPELMNILRLDEWEETAIDVQSEAYKEQKVFSKRIGDKDGYSLQLCIGNIYGGVEWYAEETVWLDNGFYSSGDVYKGGVYYTLPQTYRGGMVYDIMTLSAAQNGEEYTGERLENEVRRIVERNMYYTIEQKKDTDAYYWTPAGSETEYGPYTTQPTITEERDFLKIETDRTEWYDLKSGWYWDMGYEWYIDRIFEKRGDLILYYSAPDVGVYDLSRGEVLASVPFADVELNAENGVSYAKFANDTTVRVVYHSAENGATREFKFGIEDTAKRDPSVDPPKTALALCNKVVISNDTEAFLTITVADAHSLRVQSVREGEKTVTLSESNIVRLNALYASIKDFTRNWDMVILDGTLITVYHDGKTDEFSLGTANQRELDYFVNELARCCGFGI